MTALAQRFVACKGWRWMPGMSTDGMTVVDADETGICVVRKGTTQDHWAPEDALPDLTDPATLGCLLALVAEAYGVTLDDVHVVRTTGMVWSVWIFRFDGSSYRVATHEPSRAEALVAALEAAP